MDYLWNSVYPDTVYSIMALSFGICVPTGTISLRQLSEINYFERGVLTNTNPTSFGVLEADLHCRVFVTVLFRHGSFMSGLFLSPGCGAAVRSAALTLVPSPALCPTLAPSGPGHRPPLWGLWWRLWELGLPHLLQGSLSVYVLFCFSRAYI